MKKKTNSILILGGTGYLGSQFANYCIKKKFDVTIIGLKKKNNIKNCKIYQVDLTSEKNVKKFFLIKNDFNYIINFTGYVDHSNFYEGGDKIIRSHFISLLNILKYLNRKTLKKFINIGSSDEYGINSKKLKENLNSYPHTIYSFAKLSSSYLLQLLAKQDNFPSLILRPFLIYGPHQDQNRLIPMIISNSIKNKTIKINNPSSKRDFLYIDDFVEIVFKLLTIKTIKGEIINLGSGKSTTIRSICKMIISKINSGKIIYKNLKKNNINHNKSLIAETNKLNKYYKLNPKILLNDGIDITIKFFLKNNT